MQELSTEEISIVSGGVDWRMVATGAGIIAGGLLLAEFPPAAGAVLSIGVHVTVAGFVSKE